MEGNGGKRGRMAHQAACRGWVWDGPSSCLQGAQIGRAHHSTATQGPNEVWGLGMLSSHGSLAALLD